jgi:hypothetical protein
MKTAAKNPSQTRQPTPVRSAIRNIRFIVPFNLTRVLSNESFWMVLAARTMDWKGKYVPFSLLELMSPGSHRRWLL